MGVITGRFTGLKKIDGVAASNFAEAVEIAVRTLRSEGHTAVSGYSDARGPFVKSDCGQRSCIVDDKSGGDQYRVPVFDT